MPVIENEVGLALDQVIVATDFTTVSETAIAYAAALARRFTAKLTVANVVDLSISTKSADAVVGFPIDELRHESAESIQRILNDLTQSGVDAQGESLESLNPELEMMRLSKRLQANLIVIGTHARSGLKKMILGSFAEGVIHHADCPVITIGPKVKKPGEQGIAFQKIIFATDLQHNAAEKAAIALAFAKDSMATLYLCHVLDDGTDNLSLLLELRRRTEEALLKLIPSVAYEWCSPECVIEYGKAADHILALAQRVDADLIVLGARRRSTWMTHLSNGTAGLVLAESHCPVMTVCTD